MSRVLDVARIGGMQVGAGGFNARISDPLCPWNEGTWRFAAQDGRLQVSAAHEGDCNLTIQGLTALVAGTHDPQELELRGWGDPDPALQATLRRMFPRLWPYLHENF
jgi:predicted acetyltransferase